MSHFEPTSELNAVNRMLQSIGERPINNIGDTQRLDAANALASIHDESRAIQSRGWWFNEEYDITLSPTNGEYIIPIDVLKVDMAEFFTDLSLVKRQLKLYNLKTRTTAGHTEDIIVNWVKFLSFDDLPETARIYIARRAGVTFQNGAVGSPTLFEFTERDAKTAFGFLTQEQLDWEDLTLQTSPVIFEALFRR